MKKISLTLTMILAFSLGANAQFGKLNKKHLDAVKKTAQALTISDEDMANYVQEYVDWVDKHNVLCTTTDENPKSKAYADRLEKIKADIVMPEGMKLDIKVFYVVDQNAFACANGSIRLMAGLMDMLTDDEILGVIGHEIGHIANKDTKNAFKKALMTSALKDVVASTSETVASLTDSQLGALGEALAGAQFSQKAEYAADDYGYDLLKKCGKDSGAMASALRKIQQLQDDSNIDRSKVKQLFSTHPESGKRAARLEKKG